MDLQAGSVGEIIDTDLGRKWHIHPTGRREKAYDGCETLRVAISIAVSPRKLKVSAVEDGVRSASQAIRHGRYAAEDVIEEAKHTVKQRPLQAMGIVFAAGVLAGCFLTWIGFRRR